MRQKTLLTASLIGAGILAGCASHGTANMASEPIPQLTEAKPSALSACAQLSGFQFANTKIETAQPVAAGTLATTTSTLNPANAPQTAYQVAAHCLVRGKMFERKGTDGQDYAIGFEMRLPNNWNGRFYHQVNGGIDGVVQPSLGALGGGPITGALHQGFAVVSSDAGHRGNQNPKFGEEPTARADYGYGAVGKVTPMAKALIGAAYGRGPDRSYIGGCSNGGRHALVAASRYQQDYDGYLVGAPGYRLPNAALAQLWAGPLWQAIATPNATKPHPFAPPAANAKIADLDSALSAAERSTVANAVLAKCDALDGATDGLVQDVQACQAAFNLERDVASCTGTARTGQCLTADQKRVLTAVYAGGKTSSGAAIYSSFPYDPGISAANWAAWKFLNSQVLDPAAGYIFMSPARTVTPFKVDVDDSFNAIYASTDVFKEPANVMVSAPLKDQPELLGAVRNRGAKILMYHGVSDAIFSETDTRALVTKIDTAFAGQAAAFMRYFPVPAMAHCSAGPTLDQFDPLTPLVNWVEKGVAPSTITVAARGIGNAGGVNAELPKDWAANRSRPLCAYPTVAKYKGSGSLEDAASFSCQ